MGAGGNGLNTGGMAGGNGMTGMAGGMAIGESGMGRREEGGVIGGIVPPSSSKPVVREKKAVEPTKVEEGDWEKW